MRSACEGRFAALVRWLMLAGVVASTSGCVVHRNSVIEASNIALVPRGAGVQLAFKAPTDLEAVSPKGRAERLREVIAVQGRLDAWSADSIFLTEATALHKDAHWSGPYRRVAADTSCRIVVRNVNAEATAVGSIGAAALIGVAVGVFALLSAFRGLQ